MSKKQLPKKEPLHKFIRLTGVGLQMGITIYAAAYFGKKIDAHYQFEKQYFTFLLIIIGFVGSLVSLLVQLKKINEKDS